MFLQPFFVSQSSSFVCLLEHHAHFGVPVRQIIFSAFLIESLLFLYLGDEQIINLYVYVCAHIGINVILYKRLSVFFINRRHGYHQTFC